MDNYFNNKKQKYIALFASGGGNDIFSTMTYAKYFQNLNYNVAIYGILGTTPYYCENDRFNNLSLNHIPIEHPLIIPSETLCRYLVSKKYLKINNTEHLIPSILKEFDISNVHVRLISPKYNPEYLKEIINADLLCFCEDFKDLICIVCDFGGDILANGEPTTYSPELDSITLNVVSLLDERIIDKFIILSWLGIDGELSPNDLVNKLELIKNDIIFNEKLDPIKYYYKQLNTIFKNYIKPIRSGNTIPNALHLFNKLNNNVDNVDNKFTKFKLNKYLKIGNVKLDQSSDIMVDHSIFQNIYLCNINSVKKINCFSNIKYNDVLDLYIKVINIYDNFDNLNYKIMEPYKSIKLSDFHCQYIRCKINDIDICIQLLHIGDFNTNNELSIMMSQGINQLENNIVDALLIPINQYSRTYEYDEKYSEKYKIKYLGKFVIIAILSVFDQLVEIIENKIDKI